MKRVWIKALDYAIKTRTGCHEVTRDAVPMCIGGLAECDLNCPKAVMSHAMTNGTLASAIALADAIMPTRPMVTRPECATTVMADWRSTLEWRRLEMLDVARSPWQAHHGLYQANLLGIVLSMRWSRKRWVRSWFNRLCSQYNCDTTVQLTDYLRTVMEREDSIIYVGFSFTSSRPYIGAVEARHPILRWDEHWSAILQSGRGETSDLKY